MPWGAAIAAGGAIVGGLISANGSQSAANTQASAANRATDLQEQMWQQAFDAGAPYRAGGSAAEGRLQELLGIGGNSSSPGYGSLTQTFTPADYLANKDPGYDFQLQTGNTALNSSLAARDGVLSGAALKSLIGYNQGMAATGYQNAFDRYQTQQNNIFNRLGNLAALGQNSAAGVGSSGANFASGISGTITGAGNAAAAGQVGVANAISGGLNNAAGYYQLNNLLHPPSAGSPWAGSGAGSGWGSSFGTSGLDQTFYGNNNGVGD